MVEKHHLKQCLFIAWCTGLHMSVACAWQRVQYLTDGRARNNWLYFFAVRVRNCWFCYFVGGAWRDSVQHIVISGQRSGWMCFLAACRRHSEQVLVPRQCTALDLGANYQGRISISLDNPQNNLPTRTCTCSIRRSSESAHSAYNKVFKRGSVAEEEDPDSEKRGAGGVSGSMPFISIVNMEPDERWSRRHRDRRTRYRKRRMGDG